MPDVSEIFILQEGSAFTLFDKKITLDADAVFTISISKDTIADNLKSIIVSLSDPTDSRKQSSFLLRINKDKTAYEALIAPLTLEGRSNITIEIYDFEASVVATYKKVISFSRTSDVAPSSSPVAAWRDVWTTFSLFIILLLLLTYFFFMFFRRRSPHEDNH
jgi:ATP-dependent Zn protease